MRRRKMPTIRSTLIALGLLGNAACGLDPGTLSVLVARESAIVAGLRPGEATSQIRDGWGVRFDQYAITLGEIQVELASDPSVSRSVPEAYVVDLTQVPSSGIELWTVGDLEVDSYSFYYSTLGAAGGAEAHDSVDPATYQRMRDEDLGYLISGALTWETGDGQSCPPMSLAQPSTSAIWVGTNQAGDSCYRNPEIVFTIAAPVQVHYGPCEVGGSSAVPIASERTQTVKISIHGDHLFFNGFPEGDEGGVMRLAQWLADCDLNVDGSVDREELEAIRPSDLAELDERFQLGGAPIGPLDSMWTYVLAQLATQGHFQSEGECPIDRIGGA